MTSYTSVFADRDDFANLLNVLYKEKKKPSALPTRIRYKNIDICIQCAISIIISVSRIFYLDF